MNKSDFIELRWVISVIRRRWWFILAATLFFVMITYLITSRINPIYEASTTLLVQHASGTTSNDYNTLRGANNWLLPIARWLTIGR